jgi:hypothetical protein
VAKHHAKKAYGGCKSKASDILDLGIVGSDWSSLAPTAFPMEKSHWKQVGRRLAGPQSHSECDNKEKNPC